MIDEDGRELWAIVEASNLDDARDMAFELAKEPYGRRVVHLELTARAPHEPGSCEPPPAPGC